jgi:hypothetical protein
MIAHPEKDKRRDAKENVEAVALRMVLSMMAWL